MVNTFEKTKNIVNGQTFLNDIVKKWWYNDLRKAIDNGSNYLAALGLCEYSEIMGFLLLGMDKNQNNTKRYVKFLETMDDSMNIRYYSQIHQNMIIKYNSDTMKYEHNRSGLYGRVRCGLTHEYFIKGNSEVFKKEDDMIHGIDYDDNDDYIWFSTSKYFKEFKNTIDHIEKCNLLSNLKPIVVLNSGVVRTYTKGVVRTYTK